MQKVFNKIEKNLYEMITKEYNAKSTMVNLSTQEFVEQDEKLFLNMSFSVICNFDCDGWRVSDVQGVESSLEPLILRAFKTAPKANISIEDTKIQDNTFYCVIGCSVRIL